ncbi:MAG TPA: lanthionine synthetase LanC family protein [Allosphingosinicella sp.]|jgi:lantibiotic modifying enzyme
MSAAAAIERPLALEVAAQIGFGICRRAFWSGDRCTWLEAVPVQPHENPARSLLAGPDVYGGTAGIGWFLAEAAERTGDALLRRTARAALRQTAARAEEQFDRAPHGFYGGAAGTGAVLVAAGSVLGDSQSIEAGSELLARLPGGAGRRDAADIISGLAGTIVALAVGAHRLGGDDAMAQLAAEAGRNLLSIGERDAAGALSWQTMEGTRANLTGFAHGTAGIAHAFFLLDAVVPDRAWGEAAAAAIAYERALLDPVRGWPDFRLLPGSPPDQTFYPVAWCHGAAGIAQGRLAARDARVDVGPDIAIGLAATAAEARRALAAAGSDYTLCHGLLGLADCLLDAERRGHADVEPILAASIRHSVETFHHGERPWPSGLLSREEIGGLMLGNAGIGHFFLRLADSSLESVLVPGASLLRGPCETSIFEA